MNIRIDIHTGQVNEHDGDLFGHAVHVAAWVMAEAVGGQILTTNEVRKQAKPHVDWSFVDSGLFWLRGFPERLIAPKRLLRLDLMNADPAKLGRRPSPVGYPLLIWDVLSVWDVLYGVHSLWDLCARYTERQGQADRAHDLAPQ